ncbi:MAG: glutathione S-transferase family protein [Hyphomicrobiaceae bacterium]
MIRILGRANAINVRKILWLAEELGMAYDQEDWGRGYRATSEQEFLKINPFGKIPVLCDGDAVVRESNTILRYLVRKAGRDDLYPTDIVGAAGVEFWMDWASTDLYTGARPAFLGLALKYPGFQDPRMIETGIYEWTREMRSLDRHLATNGPYLYANRFTLADIPVGLIVNRWFRTDFSKPPLAAVSSYYELLSERPAYKLHGRNGLP